MEFNVGKDHFIAFWNNNGAVITRKCGGRVINERWLRYSNDFDSTHPKKLA